MEQIRTIWRDPTLRMIGIAVMFFGVFASSYEPYKSLIGITVFGMSDTGYAVLLAGSLLVSVAAAIGIGIITDQRPSRRIMALSAVAATLVGTLMVSLGQSTAAFVVAHVFILPIGGTMMGQLFAITRLYAVRFPPQDRDGITSVIRALFAVPFVLVLPMWGLAFDAGLPILAIYPVTCAIAVIFAIYLLRNWPADVVAPWQEAKSGLGLIASLKELLAGSILWRIVAMGGVHAGSVLMAILLALVFDATSGRSTGDVGLFFGAFVFFEIFVMLAVGHLRRYLRRLHIIGMGAACYATFLVLLPIMAASPYVWLLIFPVAVGGGLIYGLSISYLQDLLDARAGAGAALVALQRLASEALAAVIFAVGAAISGYHLVAVMGAAAILIGMAALLWLDRYAD